MKIEFDDKSYLELIEKNKELIVILCGNKSKNQLTVSSVKLSLKQVQQIVDFLNKFGV
jgi:hypothetical protein